MHDETSSYNVCCSMLLVMQVGDKVSLMFLLHRPTLMMRAHNEPLDNQLALSLTTVDMFSVHMRLYIDRTSP